MEAERPIRTVDPAAPGRSAGRGPVEAEEPGHQDLCDRQAAYVARTIAEDLDLTRHLANAVASLRACIAADESVRSGRPVRL